MTVYRVQLENQDLHRFYRVDIAEQNNYREEVRKELNIFERVGLIASSFFHTIQAFFEKLFNLNPDHIRQTLLKAEWENATGFSGITSIFKWNRPQVAAEDENPPADVQLQQIPDQVQPINFQVPAAPQPPPAPVEVVPPAPVPVALPLRFEPFQPDQQIQQNPDEHPVNFQVPAAPQPPPAPVEVVPPAPAQVEVQPLAPRFVVLEAPAAPAVEPIREQATRQDLPTTYAAKFALRMALSEKSFAGGYERRSENYQVRTGQFANIVQFHNLKEREKLQKFANELEIPPELFLDRDAQIDLNNSSALLESCSKDIPKGYSRITILEHTADIRNGSSLLIRVTQMGSTKEVDILSTDFIPGNFTLHFADRDGDRPANFHAYLNAKAFLDPKEFSLGGLRRMTQAKDLKVRTYLYKLTKD